MAIHTSAYLGTVTGAEGAPSYNPLTPVPDQILGIRNGNLTPGSELWLVACAATGLNPGAMPADPPDSILTAARLQTPRTLISPVYVRPVNGEQTFPDNPNICSLAGNPVLVRNSEEIAASAAAWALAATVDKSCQVALAAWFWDRFEPIPNGDSYWVAFSATSTLNEGAWTAATKFTFLDQPTLPAGRYAVIGMQVSGKDPNAVSEALCARLVIPGQLMRPGTLVSPSPSARAPSLSIDRSLGIWGRFDAQLPPSLEFFSGADEAASDFFGFLNVVPLDR